MGLFGRKKEPTPTPPPNAAAEIYALIEAGEINEAVRRIRTDEPLSMTDLATVIGRLGEVVGAEILVNGAASALANPDDPRALYELGYACVDVGLDEVAIRPLQAGLRHGPNLNIARELALALQTLDRDAQAAAVLLSHEQLLQPWPDRYLLAHSQLLSGDIARARATEAQLPPAGDEMTSALTGLRRRLARAENANRHRPLHERDLRGWQFATTGTILTTLSPYGFESMSGRWAYVGDSYERCALGIQRLRFVLEAADLHPSRVCVLPDHNSVILGLAVAQVLGLPAVRFEAAPESLVVAYDLTELDDDIRRALADRQPGQILFEHASNWVSRAPISPEIATLVHQVAVPPWAEQLRVLDGRTSTVGPDQRPVEEIAHQIATTTPEIDSGDGETPPDPQEALRGFVDAVRETWLEGPRNRLLGLGPVPSSRFL